MRGADVISVFSDGSSGSKGGKPGGWAWVIVRDAGQPQEQVLAAAYGGSVSTTNNIMELTGAIEGMRALQAMQASGVVRRDEVCELVSDSQYTLGITSGKYTPVKNVELAKAALAFGVSVLAVDRDGLPRTRWVRGHQGDTWNERCDSLAARGKRENTRPSILAKADAKAAKRKKRSA
jgi:ribonuclease HI